MELTLVLVVVLVALTFEYINGFHDTANSIATVVATKVLSPGQAVMLAAGMNLVGALLGTAVAKTIASGLIDADVVAVTPIILICALLGAVIWNLITWWWGLPSSSSHALVGGLCGAALAAASGDWSAILWSAGGNHWWGEAGVLPKVVLPMIGSPIAGFVFGLLLMGLLFSLMIFLGSRTGVLQRFGRTRFANQFFGKAQLVSASAMALSHGMNDAQKTMGIIALALATATAAGTLDQVPGWMHFLRIDADAGSKFEIALWIKVLCALVMAAGTAAGGWRIIKTLGHKLVKLHPIHGFAAETSAASVILAASHLGIPVSTTHNMSSAILGVGVAKRANAIRWTIVERMVWAWILTLPVSGGIAWLLVELARGLGWIA